MLWLMLSRSTPCIPSQRSTMRGPPPSFPSSLSPLRQVSLPFTRWLFSARAILPHTVAACRRAVRELIGRARLHFAHPHSPIILCKCLWAWCCGRVQGTPRALIPSCRSPTHSVSSSFTPQTPYFPLPVYTSPAMVFPASIVFLLGFFPQLMCLTLLFLATCIFSFSKII